MPVATWAVRLQVPTPTKCTMPELMVQTGVELEVTDFAPSPVVVTAGVKLPPNAGDAGRLATLGLTGHP